MKKLQRAREALAAYTKYLLSTSIVHNRIVPIVENSLQGFRYSIVSYLAKIPMHFYTHSFVGILKRDFRLE